MEGRKRTREGGERERERRKLGVEGRKRTRGGGERERKVRGGEEEENERRW